MRTVVIIEPHPLFRLGLRQLLNDALPQFVVQDYDYSSLHTPPEQAQLNCELLLLSLTAAQCGGAMALAAMNRFSPMRILLLAEADNPPSTDQDLPECVAGSVSREAPPEILQASVSLVLAGGNCFPSHAPRGPSAIADSDLPATVIVSPAQYEPARWESDAPHPMVECLQASSQCPQNEDLDAEFSTPIKPGSAGHKESQLLGLTPRQYEVLVLLARGYPMKKVGRALNISVATAKAHTETLYQRLDVHNRNAAVYTAVSRGATLGWTQVAQLQQRQA